MALLFSLRICCEDLKGGLFHPSFLFSPIRKPIHIFKVVNGSAITGDELSRVGCP